MDEAVEEELKIGVLMRKDVLRELDVIQSLSTSLLVFDMKRKQVESHFDSLVEFIERKRDEALEVIRAREVAVGKREESIEQRVNQFEGQLKAKKAEIEKARREVQRRNVECDLKEKEFMAKKVEIEKESKEIEKQAAECDSKERELKAKKAEIEKDRNEFERRAAECDFKEKEMKAKKAEIDKQTKEVDRRAVECDVKEKEMREAKKAVERLYADLSVKEKEMSVTKKAVDDLTVRIQEEDERRNATCQKLCDENLSLRDEVNSLTQQLEAKTLLPGVEEQLSTIHKFLDILTSAGIIKICKPIKHSELNGEDLFILVRDHITNQETATSKVSSVLLDAKDNGPDLVIEALRISYLNESEEHNTQALFGPCRVLLLEQLGQICPQGISQTRNEALKVAVEWSARVETCADKSAELTRFLQFLSMYHIASEFSDEVLVPMLFCVAVNEGKPDVCFTLGFANRIAGYINTMIENNMRLKALEYVCAFKLEKEFSVVKLVQGHMKCLKKNSQIMSKQGGVDSKAVQMQVLDFQIDALKELIKCITDLKLQSIYTLVNLEERLACLKRQKYFKKRPAPSSDPRSNHEQLRKKGCKLPGNAKSTEVSSNATTTFPKIGSKNVIRSNPNSDLEPLRKNRREPSGTAKSMEVTSNASNTYPKIGSRNMVRSNSSREPKPSRKNGCKQFGTVKSAEVATNVSTAYPEIGSRDIYYVPAVIHHQ